MSLKLEQHDGTKKDKALKTAKIVDFTAFSNGSSGPSSTGASAPQHMVGEYIFLACNIEDCYDDYEDLYISSLHVSNSGKLTEEYGCGRDLCFSSSGFVTTILYKAFNRLRGYQGEMALIALEGSTMHTTYHQRQIIHRLLAKQNLNVDLEDYEGTEVQVLQANEERLSWSVCSRLKKLGKAIRRGVMGGRFRSTCELSEALCMDNQDLIVTLGHGMCSELVKGATCFGFTVEACEDADASKRGIR